MVMLKPNKNPDIKLQSHTNKASVNLTFSALGIYGPYNYKVIMKNALEHKLHTDKTLRRI